MLNKDNQVGELKKELGLGTAVLAVMNTVIGSGIFFKVGSILKLTKAPGLSLFSLFLAGIITMAGGLATAELASCIPKTGGMVLWIKETMGDFLSFLCGWTFSVIGFPAIIAALSIAFATQCQSIFGFPLSYCPFIGSGAIGILTILNGMETKKAGSMGNIFTIAKLIPIILLISIALLKGRGNTENLFPFVVKGKSNLAGFGASLISCMYVYDGWMQASMMSGDLKHPKKDMPRALVIGIMSLMILFVFLLISYLLVFPMKDLVDFSHPVAQVSYALMGKKGVVLIGSGIMVSILGALSQDIFIGARVLYAMGIEEQLPFSKHFASLDPKNSSPSFAMNMISTLAIVYTLSGGYHFLTEIATFSLWIFYSLTFVAVMILRRKNPKMKRPFSCPCYPYVPIFALLGGGFILASFLVQNLKTGLISFMMIGSGIPLYYYKKNRIS